MVDDKTYIPTEVITIEDSFQYLLAIDTNVTPTTALNLLFLAIEQEKINLQARSIARASEDYEGMVDKIAERVVKIMDERIQHGSGSESKPEAQIPVSD